MENNLEYYNQLKEVPLKYLKKIEGGRLKGMSDIKPQWRIEKLTEVFGMCGFGWKFEVVKKWTENVDKSEVIAFVDLNLYVKVGDVWSEPIPGNGGSMLTAAEKQGMHNSDEAYKMATTDALGTAAKCLGLAADVYMGQGGKYETPPPPPPPPPVTPKSLKAIDISTDAKKINLYNIIAGGTTWDEIRKKCVVTAEVEKQIEDEMKSYYEQEKQKNI